MGKQSNTLQVSRLAQRLHCQAKGRRAQPHLGDGIYRHPNAAQLLPVDRVVRLVLVPRGARLNARFLHAGAITSLHPSVPARQAATSCLSSSGDCSP